MKNEKMRRFGKKYCPVNATEGFCLQLDDVHVSTLRQCFHDALSYLKEMSKLMRI